MNEVRLIRLPEVQRKVALGRSTIWLWIKQGRFPKGMKLSRNVHVWHAHDIDRFIAGEWQD